MNQNIQRDFQIYISVPLKSPILNFIKLPQQNINQSDTGSGVGGIRIQQNWWQGFVSGSVVNLFSENLIHSLSALRKSYVLKMRILSIRFFIQTTLQLNSNRITVQLFSRTCFYYLPEYVISNFLRSNSKSVNHAFIT